MHIRSVPAGKTRVAAALGAVLALTLTACGGGSEPGDTTASDTTTSAAPEGPARDSLTVGVPLLPVGIDPITYNDSRTQMVYKLVNESLYRYTGPDEVTPLLAADLPEISEDGTTWTIPLKEGITFTNGDAFDAEDVVYTFETILNPDNGSYNRSALVALESVKAIDAQTVELKLAHAFSPLMYQLTRLTMITSSIEYKPSETYVETLVGTGPYKISEIVRGQEIILEANEDFREEGVPNIPKIVVKAFPDVNSQLTALKNDQIQIIPQVSHAAVDTIKGFANVYQSDADLVATRFWLWPNLKGGIMTDEKVRKAVTIAIDRGKVVANTLRGNGYPISTLPSAREGALFYSELAQAYGTDSQIEEAKALLEEAGVAGQKLHLVVPTNAGIPEVADSIQEQLEAIGFQLEREDLTQAAALDRLFNGNYDLYLNGNTSSAGHSGLDNTFCLYRAGATCNLNGVDDPELTELTMEAVQATDDEVDDVVARLRQRQLEYVPDMPIAVGYDMTALAKDLEGFEMFNFGDYTGFAYIK